MGLFRYCVCNSRQLQNSEEAGYNGFVFPLSGNNCQRNVKRALVQRSIMCRSLLAFLLSMEK